MALPVVHAHRLLAPFAQRLLADDLPDLSPARRSEVISFVARRVDDLPSFTRFGVLVIAASFRVVLLAPAGWTIASSLARLPLPLVAEYPRLIRSLGFAYIWEHWPSTSPTGADVEAAA